MMRVLVCHRPGGAFGYISDGWINALRDRGHDARRWDNDKRSWDEFDPDLYIGCSGHKQNIPKQRRAKVAIHVNPWGPTDINGISETHSNIKWVRDMNPDAVFGYGYESDRILWSYWEQRAGIKWVPMPTAGDKTIFKKLDIDRDYDVVYLGGIWQYKAITMNETLMPVLTSGLKYKVHGWGEWPQGICDGVLPDDKACELFNRGKVAPCISEKHTREYGIDIPERVFKVLLCGALAVHDAVPRLNKIIPGIMIGRSPDEYLDICKRYSDPANEHERSNMVNVQREHVLKHHTYHNRMYTLLGALGFNADSMVA